MANCQRPNNVVQATVVQGSYVPPGGNRPAIQMGQPIGSTQVVGQPVYGSGQPVYGNPDMIGSSLYGGNYGWGDSRPPTADERGAGTGWMLYALGCFLCLCFGPVGPLFWFVVAGMHYCKPQSVRDTLPQEAAVARVSLMTAVASTCAMVALFMLLIFVVAPNAQFQGPFTCEEPCRDWSRASSPQDLYVCLDMYTKRCAAPSRNRCYNGEVHCRQKGASSDCPQSCSSFAGLPPSGTNTCASTTLQQCVLKPRTLDVCRLS